MNAEPRRRYATTAAFDAALRAKLMAQVSAQRTYQGQRREFAYELADDPRTAAIELAAFIRGVR